MLSRIADLVSRRARRIGLLALVLAVVAGALGGPVTGELTRSDRDFQDPASENQRAERRLEAAAGQDDRFGLVALVRPGGRVAGNPQARAKIARVVAAIRADAATQRVASYLDDRTPAFLSRDGRATYVAAAVDFDRREDAVDRIRERLDGEEGVQLGGRDVVFPQIGEKVSEDLARAEMIAFPILFLLSLWVFRGLIAAALPPLIGGLTIVTTFLLLRGVAQGLELSIFALNLVTGLGLGLAIDYSLFMVSRFREELGRGADRTQALRRMMDTAGRTVLFSSLTVSAALASLLVFPLRFLYSMAVGGALVSLVACVVSLVVLPAILFMLGPRVNAGAPRRLQRASERDAQPASAGGWYRLSRAVMRRPGRIALASAVAMVVVGLPFLRIDFVPAGADHLPRGMESRTVSEAIARDFRDNGAATINVALDAPRGEAGAVSRYAARVQSLAREAEAQVHPPRFLGDRTWQLAINPRGESGSDRNQELVRDIRALSAPFDAQVAGDTAAFLDQQQVLGDRLPLALAILSLTTLALLFMMTGSLVLPLKALVMNLLTISAAFGILVLIFQDGRLEGLLDFQSVGGLEATQPVLLFAVAFGLSTDYGVFLLSRIKEARDAGRSDAEAVAIGLERTGRIVTAAALLFCVAIGAFATSGVLFIKEVGVGTALAVAIDASIVRALLVPSLMVLMGRWNWWAPRPLRRLHARIGLREGGPDPVGA